MLTAVRGRFFIDAGESEQVIEGEAELVGFQAAAVLEDGRAYLLQGERRGV